MKALFFALLLIPLPAFAYFDPGTASLLIQALIGAMAAVAVFWGHVKLLFRSMFSREKSESTPGIDEVTAANGDIADPEEDANQK